MDDRKGIATSEDDIRVVAGVAQSESADDDDLLYRNIVEQSNTGVLVAEYASRKILYANGAWRKIEHVSPDEDIVGRSLLEVVAPYMPVLTQGDVDILAPDHFTEFHKIMGDGMQLLVSGRVIRWNGVKSYVLYMTDQTKEHEYKSQLENLLDHIPTGVSIFEIVGTKLNQIYVNDGFYRMLGTRREDRTQYTGYGTLSAAHPDDLPVIQATMARVLGGADLAECEYRVPNGQGEWVWIHLTGCVAERTGERALCYVTFIDVTERKLRELDYEEQLRLRKAPSDNAIVSAVLNVTQNKVIEMWGNYLGTHKTVSVKTIDELVELARGSIVDPDEYAAFTETFSREAMLARYEHGETHGAVRHRAVNYDGWLESVYDLIVNPRTGDVEAFTTARDITAEVRAEQVVDTIANADYELILAINAETYESQPYSYRGGEEMVQFLQFTGMREGQDARAERVIEYIRNACTEEEFERAQRENRFDYVKQQLDEMEVYSSAITTTPAKGSRRLRLFYTYLRGDRSIILCAVQNITQEWRRDEEQRLRLSEALDAARQASVAKTAFLSNMSHEMRTPMNAITGMTKLAEDVPGNPDETARYLREIDGSSQYLLGVINDVLDMSRIESGKLELHPVWTSPADMFWTCVNMLVPAMREKGITFVYPDIHNTKNIECFIDPLRVKQVLMNLLNNALKFTPSGGMVTLSIGNVSNKASHAVDRITIEDTGCGMSEEFLNRIFQPFEQERNPYANAVQGTGLGLALVKRIIEAMGGDVQVKSELGRGSVFSFTYPYEWRYVDSVSAHKDRAVADLSGLVGMRVLMAEDHPLNRTIATTLLEKEGVEVTCVENGKLAAEAFEQCTPGRFDAILMDIRMPVMDGLAATRAIRSCDHPDAHAMPIVAMSANAFDEDVQKSLDAGMNDHLTKPIEPALLYQALLDQGERV